MTSFKDLYDRAMVEELAGRLAAAWPELERDAFVESAAGGLDALELKARSNHIAGALAEHLPTDFERALAILHEAMGDPDANGGLEGMGGFRHMPLLDYVALVGVDELELSLDAIERMTKHFSAEFAIRPFIVAHEERTMERMEEWSRSEDWRVRRLASEGSRPRLPWGIRLQSFVEDPSPTLSILERLVEDPELIVRRSVANHLNDVSKDHEDLAARIAKGWWTRGSDEARWAAKHALRTLVKRGHAGALSALGFEGGEDVVVEDLTVSDEVVAIGGALTFSFDVVAGDDSDERLVVDFALDRQLAHGKRGTKVFKLKAFELAAGERKSLSGKQKFKQLSTRTYYAGEHHIAILINGREAARVSFEVVDA